MTEPEPPDVPSKEPPDDHPLVEAHKAKTDTDPARTVTLTGLFENAGAGRHRVYLTRDLGSYAEYNADDFISHEKVAAADSPIPGVTANRVTLKRGAQVSFVHSARTSVTADNQSDLDVQTGLVQDADREVPGYTISILKTCRPRTPATLYTIHWSLLCPPMPPGYGPPPPPSTGHCAYNPFKYTI
ncbi:MAG TPA: hypothetical protein VMF14_05345 [Solirubrobacteraceae bacterium]|nr:hypothetical protein [Solirubrobacteraceae bacterium]